MKKLIASLAVLATTLTAIPSANALPNSSIDTLFQKISYRAKFNYCHSESNAKKAFFDANIASFVKRGTFTPENVEYAKQQARDVVKLNDFTMPTCDAMAESIIYNTANVINRIKGYNASNILRESNGTTSGSFYSSTLGATVGVTTAKDMYANTGSLSSYDYVLKVWNGGAKLFAKVPEMSNGRLDENIGASEYHFKATKWTALTNKGAGNYIKLGNSYYTSATR